MSDESKKIDNADTEDKSEAIKKPATVSKKVKAKSSDNTEKGGSKKKIIEKLQAMGVMSGGKTNTATSNDDPEKGRLPKILIASAVVALVAGSFVWALNKEVADESVASSANNQVMPSAYPGAWQPSAVNSQNKNPGFDYGMQQQRVQQQREQHKKWMQQQQQAQEQQRAQQQKWAQQWQQAQEQQRAQQQKWAQQPPIQEQYRTQQQKWAQQQQQIREQQWAQQQKRAEQQRAQQPYYAYPPNTGYQGRSMPPSSNYAPGYQQPGQYYRYQY